MSIRSVRSITHLHYWQASGSYKVLPIHPKSVWASPDCVHLCPTMWVQLLPAMGPHQAAPGSSFWWLDIYPFCQTLKYPLELGHTGSCYSFEKNTKCPEYWTLRTSQNSRHLKSQNDATFFQYSLPWSHAAFCEEQAGHCHFLRLWSKPHSFLAQVRMALILHLIHRTAPQTHASSWAFFLSFFCNNYYHSSNY